MTIDTQKGDAQKGFTLVEVLIMIILAAIMGSYLYTYVKSLSESSVKPILRINERDALQEAMEKITQEYKQMLAAGNFSLAAFKKDCVDKNALVLASETKYVTFQSGEDALLMVTLQSGNQKIWSLFAE